MTNPLASKPNSGSEIAKEEGGRLNIAEQYQTFLDDVEEALNFPTLPAFSVQDLTVTVSPALTPVVPASANQDVMVMVTDEIAGRVPAYSNGTNWKRFSDNANIST